MNPALNQVAPFAGAWIEITKNLLKKRENIVAPFAGAWIEILPWVMDWLRLMVAPFAGAWIEIRKEKAKDVLDASLPSRERGLKFDFIIDFICMPSRSLRGSVD